MPGLAADHLMGNTSQPASASSVDSLKSVADLTAIDEGSCVRLERFGEEMAVLPTKTKPKKLSLHGSDGRVYNYLLKGREARLCCRSQPERPHLTY